MDISVANSLNFEPAQLPQSAQSLRPKVREFLDEVLADKLLSREAIAGNLMMKTLVLN